MLIFLQNPPITPIFLETRFRCWMAATFLPVWTPQTLHSCCWPAARQVTDRVAKWLDRLGCHRFLGGRRWVFDATDEKTWDFTLLRPQKTLYRYFRRLHHHHHQQQQQQHHHHHRHRHRPQYQQWKNENSTNLWGLSRNKLYWDVDCTIKKQGFPTNTNTGVLSKERGVHPCNTQKVGYTMTTKRVCRLFGGTWISRIATVGPTTMAIRSICQWIDDISIISRDPVIQFLPF